MCILSVLLILNTLETKIEDGKYQSLNTAVLPRNHKDVQFYKTFCMNLEAVQRRIQQMTGGALDRASILRRIKTNPPLIEGFIDLPSQLQINGVDLTLHSILGFSSLASKPSFLGKDDGQRKIAETFTIPESGDGFWLLESGSYLVNFNEMVNIPLDLMALGRARSSLLRSGVALHTAVWDSGYSGRSQALLVVYHPNKIILERATRIMQLVFFTLENPVEKGYEGIYQNEGKVESP